MDDLHLRELSSKVRVEQLLQAEEPLDEHEQQQVIASLEEAAVQQARTFRRVFAVLALALAAFFAYAAVQQQQHPYETRYTGELRPVTSSAAVVGILVSQAAALAAAGLGLLLELPKAWEHSSSRACLPPSQQPRLLVAASVLIASVGCMYWGAALHNSVQQYGYATGAKWELLWLPLGPLGYCTLCWYVLSSLGNTSKELQQLRKLAYDFKRV
jgi:hypothetical protein